MEYYPAITKNQVQKHYSVDEPWKNYAKWKKPDAKGHILYISLTWNTENR